MKLNKLILVSIFLLATLALGAVSASEDLEVSDISSSNIITNPDFSGLYTEFSDSDIITAGENVANTNEIYVNTTGDDSGAGSQKSPYATINKGISSANASDNTIIYLSEGTFTGDNNTELNINLAHGKYGGSLTIIGQGTDKTKIDGEGVGSFIKSVSGDTALTLINISFINGKSNSGSMITCGGNLTINNCLFENNYATGSQGTIVAKGMSLKVINSIFRNNTASNQGPDICFNNNNGDVVITNSTFSNSVNTGYSCGASVYISSSKNAKITGNIFKDISANYNDATFRISSSNGQIEYNTFINCTNTNTDTGYWAQYGVIYMEGVNSLKGNKFINSSSNMGLIYNNGDMNAIITFANTSTTKTTFTLNATVTDDMGNTIASARSVDFNINGKKVDESTVNNGFASVTVSKLFDNGKYIIDGAYSGNLNTYHKGTLDIDIDRTLVEFWVSTKGNDTTGDGSKLNPFNTIDHAITAALDKSINIAIHIMDGTYNGTGNVKLNYERIAILSLIGENHGKTIIDGQNTNYFFSFNKEMIVTMTNLTFANGLAGNIGWNRGVIYGALMTMNDCIIMNCSSVSNIFYDVDTQNSKLVFNNLTYINNNGNMWLGYATINNSYFGNNVGNSLGGVIRGTYSLTVTNSKFVNNTNPKNSNAEGGAIYAKDIISINNIYDSNYAGTKGGAVYVSGSEKATFINDTFINNRAAGEGGAVYSYGSSSSFIPLVTFENVKFINNTGTKGGAVAVSGATFNKVTFKDNHADIGGAIYLVPVTNGKNNNIPDLTISDDSSFENNNAPEGKDIYISTPVGNEGIANVTGLTITFNDLHVTALADKLSASVTHASGAVISGNTVTFFIGGKYAGITDVINGVATYNYVGFEDGKYSLSGTYNANGKNYIYKNGTITVAITGILDSITVYVSDANGNDSTADGSLAKPFKSIRAALEYAQSKSRTVIVNVLEGNYSGNLNVNLDIQVNIDISIIGAGENKTIISDATAKYFINALQGKGSLKIANMTIDRVGDYLNSMLYIEENVHVLIDTVEFINGKGNLGGAIYSDGILTIKNSYFFNNGYADPNKRQNAIAGGAIYNGGTLIVDNTTFEANHATRASTIANQGNLYMNNSQIIDSISASGLNMDLRVIASYNLGQVGNITLENTKILLTGRTPVDIVGSDNLYQGDRSVTCLGIGSSEKVIFINVTVDGNGSTTNGAYVFGGFNSWVETGGRSQTPKDIYVYNSTFANLKSVNVYYRAVNSTRIFDGCIFNNVDYLVDVITAGDGDSLTVKNSVILGETKVGKVANVNLTINLDNNWWGNNNGTYYEAVIRCVNGMNPTINEVSKVNATPNTWLVLTLDVTNKTGLIQDVILAFKVFNGTNLTDYTGSLPARIFTMDAINATISMVTGNINSVIITGVIGEGEGDYSISAIVDNQVIDFNGVITLGNRTSENIDLYVSDLNGDDNNDGSLTKPFKTIKYALAYGQSASKVVTIHVLEGVYKGISNTNITLPNNTRFTIVGAGKDKTIIGGEDLNFFVNMSENASATIANLTLYDMSKNYVIHKVQKEKSAIIVGKGANLTIDGVNITKAHGYNGGAINNNGNVNIFNSIFFNCGDSNYGGAIYNTENSVVNVYNSKFIANHAKYSSAIYNLGVLNIVGCEFEDNIRVAGWSGTLDVIGGNTIGNKGNVTLINSKVFVTGKKISDIVGENDTWPSTPNQASAKTIGVGGTYKLTVINSTFDGYNKDTTWSASNNWIAIGSGGGMTPMSRVTNLEVYNSTFRNLGTISNSPGSFDSCVFENFNTFISYVKNDNPIVVKNSVIIGNVLIKPATGRNTIDVSMEDNWWGSNDQPSYTLIDSQVNVTSWLVLTMDITNNPGLIQDVILTFKYSNGTAYDKVLPMRNFNMSAVGATFENPNGTVSSVGINKVIVNQDGSYTVYATVDNQLLSVSGDAALIYAYIKVDNYKFDYGDEIVVSATVLDSKSNKVLANCRVILTVNGKEYVVFTDANGVATFKLSQLPAGTHWLTFKIGGDNIYNPIENISIITVNKVKSSLTIGVTDIVVGEDETIIVSAPKDATGEIIIKINDKEYRSAIVDGKATFKISGLNSGSYSVIANYDGNDKYMSSYATASFKVINKEIPSISIDVKDIIIGEDETIVVTVNDDATGNVEITINGETKVVAISNGKATLTVKDLAANNYNVVVKYLGDSKYQAGEKSASFTVSKISDYEMDVNVEDIKVGETVTIKVTAPSDINGKVIISINGKNQEVTMVNGVATVNVSDLAAGKYDVVVKFNGNDKYVANSASNSFTVSKISDYNMTIDVPSDIKVGENATIIINVPKDATGTVTVTIGDKTYTVNVVDGIAKVITDVLNSGNYTITAKFNGDNKYAALTKQANMTVDGSSLVNLDVDNIVMFYQDGTRLVAVLTDYKGNPIANATIYFVINGITYARTTNVNGSASMALNLKAGIYNASVLFNGTDKYDKVAKNTTVIIRSTIEAADIVKMYQNGTQFFAKFFDKNGKLLANTKVTFNINGVFYTRETNKDGVARLAINLRPGKYILTAINPVNSEEQGFNITVRSLIEAGDLTKYFQNASKFEATIYNKDGSLAVNKEVTFNINGVFYKRTTNDKGVVSLAINLRPGNYTITTMYDGLEMGNKVNVLPTLETKDLSMKFQDGSKFTARTVDGQGKPLANQNVTFNVNGVFYHRVSDANGIASLNINLIAGEYVITSIWNDFQVGNKITIA